MMKANPPTFQLALQLRRQLAGAKQRLSQSTFLRHNAIFFVGSTAVSFLNYLYYPVLGRLLTPTDFGEVQTVISFFLQIGVLLAVLSLVTIGVVKRYPDDTQRQAVLGEIERMALWISIGLFALVVILSGSLQHYLNFRSPGPFILLAASVLLSVPGAFAAAYIQAHQRFGVLSSANFLGAGTKLLLSAGLVVIGFRTMGAILGVVLAQLLALGYTVSWARRLGRRLSWRGLIGPRRPNLALLRPELRYAALVLITSLAVNGLLSCDIIVAKHYFSPRDAGLYAGIATIARIIFFLTGPLAGVLIASVKPAEPAHNRALLWRSLILLVGLGGSALAVFILAPKFVVTLLIGARYVAVAPLLPLVSLAVFLLSLANLLVYYHVALRHVAAAVASSVGLIVAIGWFGWHHATLYDIAHSYIWGSLVFVLLVGILSRWEGSRAR